MFNQLKQKWKVTGLRLFLILFTFALGGSLTGYAGRKVLEALSIGKGAGYVFLYIILITLLWPFTVVVVSIPLGQFRFFTKYIYKIAQRMSGRKQTEDQPAKNNVPHTGQGQATKEMAGGENSNPKSQTASKHLVIFASGAGSNAQQIINYFRSAALIKVVLIVCNKPGAGVLSIAEKEGIPTLLIEKERFFRGDAYVPLLQDVHTDLIILAGFLWKIPHALISTFPRRIVNIHPALLPKWGGKGMYGQYVHESVLQAGEVESGITIHYVDEQYDHGDIIFQTACPVLEGDTHETLARRIHQLEHLHYPVVIDEVVAKLVDAL
jgi:formyltetrahydrofolate-dependent phosphoribosylglycinamide formyltransferase